MFSASLTRFGKIYVQPAPAGFFIDSAKLGEPCRVEVLGTVNVAHGFLPRTGSGIEVAISYFLSLIRIRGTETHVSTWGVRVTEIIPQFHG